MRTAARFFEEFVSLCRRGVGFDRSGAERAAALTGERYP